MFSYNYKRDMPGAAVPTIHKGAMIMRILIDADGCPVVDIAVNEAKSRGLDCVILCDTAHVIERPGICTITVEKGADSVDFKLVNLLSPGDIAVTQDYGLAAMCLARRAAPIRQNGLVFTEQNIDALLLSRHTAKKIRRQGGRLKGPAKRTPPQDEDFRRALIRVLDENMEGGGLT